MTKTLLPFLVSLLLECTYHQGTSNHQLTESNVLNDTLKSEKLSNFSQKVPSWMDANQNEVKI